MRNAMARFPDSYNPRDAGYREPGRPGGKIMHDFLRGAKPRTIRWRRPLSGGSIGTGAFRLFGPEPIGGRQKKMLDDATMAALSTELIRAVTEPRLELLDDLLTDDFVMWHNFSRVAMTRAEALGFFHRYFPTIRLSYHDIRLTPTAAGWVQQHLVNSDTAAGAAVRDMPACMVVTVAGRRISRIDEYIDTAQAGGFDAAQMRPGQ
jgi:ketosteroid isomerase-like protein